MSVDWLDDYFNTYREQIFRADIRERLIEMRDLAIQTRDKGGKLIFAGNGASAAIASHSALDFTKQGKVRSICFSDSALITGFANDYGYEDYVARALEFYADPQDVVVLISSSGRSPNIVSAARYAKQQGHTLVGFSGFGEDNPLNQAADLKFRVASKAYNIIECTHMLWICTVIDLVIGKAEYAVS